VFLPKSAETLEKKRVEFCVSAKKCKRVRKNVKIKGIPRFSSGQAGDKGQGIGTRDREGVHTPGILYEYQNKGIAKFAIHKCMKRKG
jgi:hypothetical protein